MTKYTVQLPHSLQLTNGEWEVGLSEIHFTKSWFNIKNCSFETFKITEGIPDESTRQTFRVPDGYYATEQDLIDELNSLVNTITEFKRRKTYSFSFNKNNKICTLNIKSGISFSNNLTHILGFTPNKLCERPGCVEGTNPMKVKSISNVMVYSDAVQSNLIGDIEAPLLRSIAITGDHWDVQWVTFNEIQYLPVSKHNFRSITVYLYTDFGEPVSFTNGRTIVTLDFRRKQPSIL